MYAFYDVVIDRTRGVAHLMAEVHDQSEFDIFVYQDGFTKIWSE